MTAVSVVLITYNDAERLPRAIASLRDQTLRDLEILIVDDASTDGTPTIIAEAMAADPRIRTIRLATNSGGCSTPRNAGLRAASGDWVMFCDSDDEFERHAAKNLLLAVERADADLGCGVAERIDTRTGVAQRWRADLHEPAVLDSILDRPELIADTVSVNKIYRRRWLIERGITFPEGILYEDQLFTMRAYAEAHRIAVSDRTVYRWYVARQATDRSITQRRHEVRNAMSRVEVNRLIDAYLAEHGPPALARVKDRKFLSHDCYLYLSSMLEMDDDEAMAVIDVLHPYVASVDMSEAANIRPALRIAILHLLLRDLEGIRAAMRFVNWSATVDMPIVPLGDRDLWGCEHLAQGGDVAGFPMSWWLDVTVHRLRFAGDARARWCHRPDTITLRGRHLRIAGRTIDAFGRLADVDEASIVLSRGGEVVAELPASFTATGDGAWTWTADGVPTFLTRVSDGDGGAIGLRLRIDGVENIGQLRAAHVPRHVGAGRAGARGLRTQGGDYGAVRWQAGHFTRLAKVRAATRRAWQRAWRPLHHLWLRAVRRLAHAMPARGVIAASSRGVGGAPWALVVGDPGLDVIWADALRPGTTRRAWTLGRARWCIQDGDVIAPSDLSPKAELVIAPEGIDLLRTGRASPDWDITPARRRRPRPSNVARWRHAVVANPWAGNVLRDASGFAGSSWFADPIAERLRSATPTPVLAGDRRMVVLSLPVGASAIDLAAFARELGDRAILGIRSADGRPVDIPAVLRATVVDVSAEPDVAGLLAAADIVVTDASPLSFAAALAGIPIVIHAPRLDELVARIGMTVDLRTDGPGPVTATTDELITTLRELIDRDGAIHQSESAFGARGRADGSVAAIRTALRGGG